jgi:adenosyl cobinamide kinase/adenosyl cobinamide phosphate guanylyltransferase
MSRRRCPAFLTLFLFRNQSVTYPRRQPSIRTLIRQIEALGYEVFIIPRDIGWGVIPQEDWGTVVLIFIGDIDDSR